MDAVTHPEPRVAETLNSRFVPVKASLFEKNPHFKEIVGRTTVPYAPTLIALGTTSGGRLRETRRWIGWLAPDDYLAELALVEGLDAIQTNRFDRAVELLEAALAAHPDAQAAPETLFWKGVARFRAGGRDLPALAQDHEELLSRYPDSPWAERAAPIRDR